jgi:AcrR family transcriptional regulator
MTAPVDHAARRRQVCEIAGRLIASAGLEAVTFRDIAAEAGCSTRIVSHYFRDKRELLLAIFLEFSARSLDRCEAALLPPTDPVTVLEAVLPLDSERRMFWQVWLAFWGRVIGDEALQRADRAGKPYAQCYRAVVDR